MVTRVSVASLALPGRPHALYRFYDRTDALLYVGITCDLPSRLRNHRRDKPWWVSVNRIAVEQFTTRREALVAETAAIRDEAPLFNEQHNDLVEVAGSPESADGALLLTHWPKLPPSVRDFIEVPAWASGRLEFAERLLDVLDDSSTGHYRSVALRVAEADEETPTEDELVASTAYEAFRGFHEDRSRLEHVLDDLLRRVLGGSYSQRRDEAAAAVSAKMGSSAGPSDALVWAATQCSSQMDRDYLGGLPPDEQTLWIDVARSIHGTADEAEIQQEAGRHARNFHFDERQPPGLCSARSGSVICVRRVGARVQLDHCARCATLGRRECGWHRIWCMEHAAEFAAAGTGSDWHGNAVPVNAVATNATNEWRF